MDFFAEEFENRCDSIQQAMHRQQFDALLITTEAEMRYFTGFRTLFWQSPTRPWFLIIPISGKPIAVIPEIGSALMRETWIEDIRTWSSPHANDDGISLLIDIMKNYPHIAIPKGRESSLRMPLADFSKMSEQLKSHCHFHDATPILTELRMIKSEQEIAKLQQIGAIASRAFAKAHQLFQLDDPLDSIFRKFKIALLEEGADDVPYLVGGKGQGGYGDVISPPGSTRIKEGDILMLDTGATYQGYFCDFDRNYAFSRADDNAKRGYEALYNATNAALKIARPGTPVRELYQVMQKVINQKTSDVGRFGHGLGIQLTEPPSLIDFDDTILQKNMVITLEPSMALGAKKIMVHEENLVITDGPPIMLSERAAPELPIL